MNKNDFKEIIENKLSEYMQIEKPKNLFESMRYTLMLPGKRLRPIMCLETCKMFGQDYRLALPCACAIEMLHVQTLIHDDLPCMDNDDFRRGKPTNHVVFGEALATLAGDALLTFAPQVITKYSTGLTPATIIRILSEYFHYAGARGVIAGQAVDIVAEEDYDAIENKEEALIYLQEHKTSDLFQLAMRSGAIIADADDDALNGVTEFAKTFGIAFQIADDVLDEISTFEKLGKTIGKDRDAGKLTSVRLYGVEKSKLKISCLINRCRDIMKEQDFKSEVLEQILTDIIKRVGL